MCYDHDECFSCYFGGKGSNLQLKPDISDEDEATGNIYNDNVEQHSLCFGCMYNLSTSESFFRAIASITKITNKVEFHYCALCKKKKLCITNITVCDMCQKPNDGIKDSGDNEDNDDEDDDKNFTEENEDKFYNSIETLCFRCIDNIQCEYKYYPRNKDILLWYIQRKFVNTYKFECGKCHNSRWACTTKYD